MDHYTFYDIIVDILVLSLIPLLLFVVFVQRIYTYWARHNVPFIEPRFPYGSFHEINKKSLADIAIEFYRRMKPACRRFYGVYFFLRPVLTVTDPDLIKRILIKDFNYFPDRGIYHNARDDPLSANLFAIEGNRWRLVRQRLSLVFTSGKLRMMFPTLTSVSDNFAEYLSKTVGDGCELEIKDCTSRFTTEVIGSCAFGIECNSFNESDSEFQKYGRKVFDAPRHSHLMGFLLSTFPSFGRALRIKALDSSVAQFFYWLVKNMVEYREKNSVARSDFLNQLIQIKKSGFELSDEDMAAQSFILFANGFDTSSSNQTFCLYELAKNPEWQEKARQCVLDAIRKHGGLTYEAVGDMKYLDQCINETLRMYPPIPVLERKPIQDYHIPDSNLVIPKGLKVLIPVIAIHRDDQYYPDPERFDPNRFIPEEVAKRHPCTFMPFGEGQRICIAVRFGMMQSRVGLATILSKYRLSVCSKTENPLKLSIKSFVLHPKEGLWLKVDPV